MALKDRARRVVRDMRQKIPSGVFLGRRSSGLGPVEFIKLDETIGALLDGISSTRGSILYRGSSGWAALTPGTSGDFLKTNGAGADPEWASASGGGGDLFFDPPAASEFPTSVVQGAGSSETEFTDVTGLGLSFVGAVNGSNHSVARYKTAPTAPFTFTFRQVYGWDGADAMLVGVALRNSSTGDLEMFGPLRASTASTERCRLYNGTSAPSSALRSSAPGTQIATGAWFYIQVHVDGSGNITYRWSRDGRTYFDILTSTVATHIGTLDQIGFMLWSFTGGTNKISQVISYHIEA